MPPPPAASRRKRAALALLATLFAAVTFEVGYRLWRRLAGRPYDTALVRGELDDLGRAAGQLTQRPDPALERERDGIDANVQRLAAPHPYYGYEAQIAIRALDRVRREHIATADENHDLLILGGSVAEMFGRIAATRLIERLAADPRYAARPIRVLNFGRTTFKQPQQQMLLAYLLSQGFRPDAVINLDGFNEVALPPLNRRMGIHPAHPAGEFWLAVATLGPDSVAGIERYAGLVVQREQLQAMARDAAASAWLWSALAGEWQLGRVRRARQALEAAGRAYTTSLAAATKDRPVMGPPFADEGEAATAFSVEVWAESSLTIQAMCAARSIRYLHVLQPTLHLDGSKPFTEEEMRNAKLHAVYREGVQAGYPRMRATLDALRARGIEVFDATQIFADRDETLYSDACHLLPAGNLLLAEEIAGALLRRPGPLQPPTPRIRAANPR